jgi:hemerythrin-like domain-containing protein
MTGTPGRPPGTAGFDDARPSLPVAASAETTAVGRANAQALVDVHDHLRAELQRVRDVVAQVAESGSDLEAARSLVNRMTMRQNYWSLGAFCASYCRLLTLHHTIEDHHMFASLRDGDAALGPVLERLGDEHEIIAGMLARLDESLVSMVGDPERIEVVRDEVDEIAAVLLSHLAYEEEQLLGPIARLGVQI